jgi:hypothetical protein
MPFLDDGSNWKLAGKMKGMSGGTAHKSRGDLINDDVMLYGRIQK